MKVETRGYVFGRMVLLQGSNAEGWEVFNFLTGLKHGDTHATYAEGARAAKALAKWLNDRFQY